MRVLIRETGEIDELVITDAKTGLAWTGDFVGNAGAFIDGQFVYDEDEDYYVADQDTFDWWENVAGEYEKADYAKKEFLDSIEDEDARIKYDLMIQDACNCDLEYMPNNIMQTIAEIKEDNQI